VPLSFTQIEYCQDEERLSSSRISYCFAMSTSMASLISSPTTAAGYLGAILNSERLIVVVAEKPQCGFLSIPETGPVPEKKVPIDTATVVQQPEPVDTFGRVGPARDRGHGRIGPAQGEGKLWVRPLPLPPCNAITRGIARSGV